MRINPEGFISLGNVILLLPPLADRSVGSFKSCAINYRRMMLVNIELLPLTIVCKTLEMIVMESLLHQNVTDVDNILHYASNHVR